MRNATSNLRNIKTKMEKLKKKTMKIKNSVNDKPELQVSLQEQFGKGNELHKTIIENFDKL